MPKRSEELVDAIVKVQKALDGKNTELDLSNLKLSKLPKNIEQLVQLKKLDLSGNRFTHVPREVFQLCNLEDLNLEKNKLVKVDESIRQLSNIKKINLQNNQLLNLPDSLGSLENLEELWLCENRLITLPNAIGQLKKLKKLSIYNNQLTSLPDTLGGLESLEGFWIYENQLVGLPNSIGQLRNLKKFSVNNNQLTSLPDTLGGLESLEELWVYANHLISLPNSIGKLRNLKKFSAHKNQLTSLPNTLEGLENLEEFWVYENQLVNLPESIGQLKKLKNLSLYSNQLTSLPATIKYLKNLEKLWLYKNKLVSLPEAIGQLKKLISLSIYNNQLTSLPDAIGCLESLEELWVYENQLTSLPESIGQLKKLKKLSVFDNRLTKLPANIGSLADLEGLWLGRNQLVTLPKSIGNLSNLRELGLHDNQLKTLPETIWNLSNLSELYLYGNQLTSLSDSLENLIQLKKLSLHKNQLQRIPETISKLSNLSELYLYENQLEWLPSSLKSLPSLKVLSLQDNKLLNIPPEILSLQKPIEILDYYFRIQEHCKPLNEAKLILVGYGAVGKTSLVNRLVYDKFDASERKTEGIQITSWDIQLNKVEDIKLHMWDFGGQEIMHSTHQFFLTERSLYLLVLNGRQGHEDTDAEYWLELIQSFGGDSPIIVVLNKQNEHPFDVNRSALRQKFPTIRNFVATDCEDGTGLDLLRTNIYQETDRLEYLRAPFPTSWLGIKNQLSAMKENYIPFEKYREICTEQGETDTDAQNLLAVHLHSLGIALNYKDDPRLRDTHVLNPHWVTSGIYTLLNAHDLTQHKGELGIADLGNFLDRQNYPPERHGFLLELMRKFELCFRFPEEEARYLIPDLLDKQQPPEAEEFSPTNCLNFQYDYPILPEGLLPRFIVRTHVLSTQRRRWRTGVILHFEGNRALVKADRQDRQVTILVDGPTAGRRRLLAIIRSDFDRIHSSFTFRPEEKVPVPNHPDLSLNYQDLLVMEQEGLREVPMVVRGKVVKLNVQDLLNGVDLDGTRRYRLNDNTGKRPVRLFYSYSHKDEELRDQLDTHLKILERQQLIHSWHDRRIVPGTDWAQDIDDYLNQADIILLLISADFIASDYCYNLEMKRAVERHQAREAVMLPVIVRDVDWEIPMLKKLKVLPTDRRAVTLWSDRDSAWRNVEDGIKQVIQHIQSRN
jgi:internalin A